MTEIYQVLVYKLTKDQPEQVFDESTSASTPLNAMASILDTARSREMLANQKAINEPEPAPAPGGSWEEHPFHINNAKPRKANVS